MGRYLGPADVDVALKGGAVFACGGGGFLEHGRTLGLAAVNAGRPELVGMDEVPDDAFVATAAAIGAPGGFTAWEMRGIDYVKAVQLVERELGAPIHGLMIGQNGKSSTVNAWLPSAILGCKVVDAVGDVRAHPTGDMGSIGLANAPDPTIQSAVGGNRAENRYIELVAKGPTARISPILRTAGAMAGGFIASCRNPVRAAYVRRHAALGGISMALKLGEAILAAERAGRSVFDAIVEHLQGEIIGRGAVTANTVAYQGAGAFDIGTITLGRGEGLRVLHVMNEHMAVETGDGERLATFPDVITTLSPGGEPLSSSELPVGREAAILRVSKTKLPLGAGVLDPSVYPVVEAALGLDIATYALG
jgi:DUF917 family protein